MMDPREIRGWLLCQPRPHKLRILASDQQQHELEIMNGMSWAQTAESVAALQPDLIEALDPKGKLIRAIRPSEIESKEEESDDDDTISLAQDPESVRLVTFAKLIADAYKHSTDVAFDKLTSLFEAVNRRSESLEKTVMALTRLREKQILDAAAEAAGESGPLTLDDMMQGFLQGQAMKAAERAAAKPNGATNGAAKHTEDE